MTTPLGTPIPSIQELQDNSARLLQQSLSSAQQTGAPLNSLSATDQDLARTNIKALSFVLGMGWHGVMRYLRDFIAQHNTINRPLGAPSP